MSTDKKSKTLMNKIKNVFSILNSFFSSKYFLIPAFGLDFALRGGTKPVIPMLASMGITVSAPLIAEIAFALLVGVGTYYVYQATMDYVIAPIMNFCGFWFNRNIYQPCCHFVNGTIFNASISPISDTKPKHKQEVKPIILNDSPAVFLPSASKGTIGGIPVACKQDQQEQKKSPKLPCKN